MRARKAESSTFTPEPWTAEAEAINSITIRAASKSAHKRGREIASVMNEEQSKLTPTMWANARLIAAAPSLYGAAMSALAYLQTTDSGERGEVVAAELLTALVTAAD